MNEKRIYKLSLLLPIVLPALFWLVTPRSISVLPDWLGTILMTGILSGVIGGIPYAVIAICLLVWMWNEDAKSIRKVLVLSPIFMLVAFIPCLLAYLVLSADTSLQETNFLGIGYLTLIFSVYILVIGYFYVLVTFGAARLFRGKPFSKRNM